MSVVTLGVALGVSGLFALLAWKAHDSMTAMRANLSIEAFFSPNTSSDEASIIAKRDAATMGGISRTIFISKEQALDDYTKASGENVEQVLGMNPLPASVKVFLTNPNVGSAESVEAGLRSISGIEEVRSNIPLLQTMESRSLALDRIALIIGSLMIVSAFFYALMAGRHSFDARRETLHTLDLLGATQFASVAPIVISSALGGIAGGILGTTLILVIHQQFLGTMASEFALSLHRNEYLLAFGTLVCGGLVIGVFGTLASSTTKRKLS